MQQAVSARTPAHLWIVGALATLWNAFGAYDYLMTRKRDTGVQEQQRHGAPVDASDMTPSLGTETPESEAIEEDGEPLGGNFA